MSDSARPVNSTTAAFTSPASTATVDSTENRAASGEQTQSHVAQPMDMPTADAAVNLNAVASVPRMPSGHPDQFNLDNRQGQCKRTKCDRPQDFDINSHTASPSHSRTASPASAVHLASQDSTQIDQETPLHTSLHTSHFTQETSSCSDALPASVQAVTDSVNDSAPAGQLPFHSVSQDDTLSSAAPARSASDESSLAGQSPLVSTTDTTASNTAVQPPPGSTLGPRQTDISATATPDRQTAMDNTKSDKAAVLPTQHVDTAAAHKVYDCMNNSNLVDSLNRAAQELPNSFAAISAATATDADAASTTDAATAATVTDAATAADFRTSATTAAAESGETVTAAAGGSGTTAATAADLRTATTATAQSGRTAMAADLGTTATAAEGVTPNAANPHSSENMIPAARAMAREAVLQSQVLQQAGVIQQLRADNAKVAAEMLPTLASMKSVFQAYVDAGIISSNPFPAGSPTESTSESVARTVPNPFAIHMPEAAHVRACRSETSKIPRAPAAASVPHTASSSPNVTESQTASVTSRCVHTPTSDLSTAGHPLTSAAAAAASTAATEGEILAAAGGAPRPAGHTLRDLRAALGKGAAYLQFSYTSAKTAAGTATASVRSGFTTATTWVPSAAASVRHKGGKTDSTSSPEEGCVSDFGSATVVDRGEDERAATPHDLTGLLPLVSLMRCMMYIALFCIACLLVNSWRDFLHVLFVTLLVLTVNLPSSQAWPRLHRSQNVTHDSSTALAASRNLSKLVVKDSAAFDSDSLYLVPFIPHKAQANALPSVFSDHSATLPPALRDVCHIINSDMRVWDTRNLGHMAGTGGAVFSAAYHCVDGLLAAGRVTFTVASLGGSRIWQGSHHRIEELIVCRGEQEGLARLALRHRSPMVPAFAFGKSATAFGPLATASVQNAAASELHTTASSSCSCSADSISNDGNASSSSLDSSVSNAESVSGRLPDARKTSCMGVCCAARAVEPLYVAIGSPVPLPAAATAAAAATADASPAGSTAPESGSASSETQKFGSKGVNAEEDAEVELYLQQYLCALHCLFETSKKEAGWAHLILKVE